VALVEAALVAEVELLALPDLQTPVVEGVALVEPHLEPVVQEFALLVTLALSAELAGLLPLAVDTPFILSLHLAHSQHKGKTHGTFRKSSRRQGFASYRC
jgi:hypothetical protein